jgi:hypothetical protein
MSSSTAAFNLAAQASTVMRDTEAAGMHSRSISDESAAAVFARFLMLLILTRWRTTFPAGPESVTFRRKDRKK